MSIGSRKSGLSDETKLADLEVAWREREAEAVLLTPSHPLTALGSRIYALEIKLKVIACKTLRLHSLPKALMTHALDELVIFTGLYGELAEPTNEPLKDNWDQLVSFSRNQLNQLRYLPQSVLAAPTSKWDPTEITKVLNALDHPVEGVSQWLSPHL